MSGKTEWIEVFQCSRCGASLNPSIDSVVAICPYCGYPNPVIGTVETKDIFIVPSKIDVRGARKYFYEYVRRDRDLRMISKKIEIAGINGYYIPLWVVRASYKGVVRAKSISRFKPQATVSKNIYGEAIAYTLARRHVTVPFLDEAFKRYLATKPKAYRLDRLSIKEWMEEGIELFITDTDKSAIYPLIKRRIVRSVINSLGKGYEVISADVDIEYIGEPILLLLPIWIIYYRVYGTIYYAVLTGWDGYRVGGIEPNTVLHVALNTLLMIGLAIVTSLYTALIYVMPYYLIEYMVGYEIYVGLAVISLIIFFGLYKFLALLASLGILQRLGQATFSIPRSLLVPRGRDEEGAPIIPPPIVIGGSASLYGAFVSFTIMVARLAPLILPIILFIASGGLFIVLLEKIYSVGERIFSPVRAERRA